MATYVRLPKWGTLMRDAYLVCWLKDEGEPVEAGDPLFELDTEKATNVVEAPASGRLGKIVAEAGESYPVGEILAVILGEGEIWNEDSLAEERRAAAQEAAAAATPSVFGHIPLQQDEGGFAVGSSPAARRLARAYDVDLTALTGSGPDGRVVVDDVLRSLAQQSPLPGSRFILLGGRAVHLLDVGEGLPVVLLHGAGGSNWSWVPVLERLQPGYRLIAPDFPGCGLSEAAEGDYSLDFCASFMTELLEALEIPRAHAIGNSLGAAVALRMAARRPELFDRLVLVDSAGLGQYVHPDLYGLLLRSSEPEGAQGSLALLFHNQRLVTHGLVQETLRQRQRPGAVEALAKSLEATMAPGKQLIDVRPDLAALTSPILLVWGGEDRVTPLEQAEAAAAENPNVYLEVLDDSGHCPQVEQPRAFARLVRRFLGG